MTTLLRIGTLNRALINPNSRLRLLIGGVAD